MPESVGDFAIAGRKAKSSPPRTQRIYIQVVEKLICNKMGLCCCNLTVILAECNIEGAICCFF